MSRAEHAFTAEQRAAIERRDGDLILSAAAGSGKTAVLVERYVRSVLDDDMSPAAVLAITFTEQAAAEMRARIRAGLRGSGREDLAEAAREARVSTIHALCHSLLRDHALAAGIDPGFEVLDATGADRLARVAYDLALGDLAANAGDAGLDLLARTTPVALRGAVRWLYATLRSRGERTPALPEPAPRDPAPALAALADACPPAVAERADLDGKGAQKAAAAIEACGARLAAAGDRIPEPGELPTLPARAGPEGPALDVYRAALVAARRACADHHLAAPLASLDVLLRAFGDRYRRTKRARSVVDFADLELLSVELLRERADVRGREAARWKRVMVDELQDVNAVQLELLDLLAPDGWFAVGDAAQSIYGFRNADVALFTGRRERLGPEGRALELRTSFRGHPELLDLVNVCAGSEIEGFSELVAGREPGAEAGGPRVEMLITDRSEQWTPAEVMDDGERPPCAPWRMAEARALAARIRGLIDAGHPARDVVVLLRAATDLVAYERALDDEGVPTYVIGGRGFWDRREVADLVAWLSVLANALDEPRLWEVLASPLVGLSSGALVHVAAAARDAGCDPWTVLREAFAPQGLEAPARLELAAAAAGLRAALADGDREILEGFVPWAVGERRVAVRRTPSELLARAIAARGFDLAVLRMPGGERRLANIRKLGRLVREHAEREGPGLRGLLAAIAALTGSEPLADAREGEAPVEGEDLDAVRLMTIHRSKGLEFPVVCVADLGRQEPTDSAFVRLGRDGRIGLRMRPPGGGRAIEAFDWEAVGAEVREASESEARRLFYVAMTRARERLVLSGAVDVSKAPSGWKVPLGWIAERLLPGLEVRIERGEEDGVVAHPAAEREARVRFAITRSAAARGVPPDARAPSRPRAASTPVPPPEAASAEAPSGNPAEAGDRAPVPVPRLSYTALAEAGRCGRRYYLERILRLPAGDRLAHDRGTRAAGLDPAVRGSLVHRLLESAPLGEAAPPSRDAVGAAARGSGLAASARALDEVAALVAAGAGSATARRLAAAGARREVRFVLELEVPGFGATLLTGAIDALGIEGDTAVVLDWKSDRLGEGEDPERAAARDYGLQRLVYALAVLRAGHARAEIAHLYLERPDAPAVVSFTAGDLPVVEAELAARARPILAGELEASPAPWRGLCTGCPGRGTLCPHPRPRTERAEPPPDG